MENQTLINLLIDIFINIASFIFVYTLYKKYQNCNDHTKPTQISFMIFWSFIFIYFLIDAIRQIFIIAGTNLQLPFHFMLSIPLTLVSLPIVFIIIYIISGNKYTGIGVSSIFLIFSFFYFYYIVPIDQLNYITENAILLLNNDVASIIFISGLFIVPTSMIFGLLTLILLKRISTFRKYKICLSLLSISIVFDFLFLTSISQNIEMLIGSKIFVFLGIILGYLANYPPKLIESKCLVNITAID
jgi:hypothetical protein